LPVRLDKKTVEIAYGTSTFEMALLLYKEGILRNPLSFLFLHSVEKKKLEAGEYEFDGLIFPWDAYEKISKGLKKLYRITIPEGSDLYDISKILEENLICSSKDFLKYALSEETARKYKLKTPNMEGFLFPDTYFFSKNTHPMRVIDTMYNNFFKVAKHAVGPTHVCISLSCGLYLYGLLIKLYGLLKVPSHMLFKSPFQKLPCIPAYLSHVSKFIPIKKFDNTLLNLE